MSGWKSCWKKLSSLQISIQILNNPSATKKGLREAGKKAIETGESEKFQKQEKPKSASKQEKTKAGESKKSLETGENEKCLKTGEDEKSLETATGSVQKLGETTGKKCVEICIRYNIFSSERQRREARRKKFTPKSRTLPTIHQVF